MSKLRGAWGKVYEKPKDIKAELMSIGIIWFNTIKGTPFPLYRGEAYKGKIFFWECPDKRCGFPIMRVKGKDNKKDIVSLKLQCPVCDFTQTQKLSLVYYKERKPKNPLNKKGVEPNLSINRCNKHLFYF